MSIVFIIGPSGCGKSTVGEMLSKGLELPFLDADTLHCTENVEKMSLGLPLNDLDRMPWLDLVRSSSSDLLLRHSPAVIVACSALKVQYRNILRGLSSSSAVHPKRSPIQTYFIFLQGTRNLLARRMLGRKGHFFKATMLDSQLATLEEPTDAEGADNYAVLKLGKEGNEDEEVEEVELHAKAQEIVEEFLARNSSSLL